MSGRGRGSGEGALPLVCLIRVKRRGNLADRFLDYFDLRLFYIYAATTSSRLQLGWISRLDTLSAADNLLALRAKNANKNAMLLDTSRRRDKGVTEHVWHPVRQEFLNSPNFWIQRTISVSVESKNSFIKPVSYKNHDSVHNSIPTALVKYLISSKLSFPKN